MKLLLAFLACICIQAFAKNTFSPYWGEYNTKGGPVEGKINVHLVPHTHDDVGWLITVDQYYFSEVNYILDTVMTRLQENPDRKFMYVESGFFERWWIQQTNQTKDAFRKLVDNGQLEFINGGWAMHDEAAPNYVEMIENTARGHQFLLKEFGIKPKGGWGIDPFGHTNGNALYIGQYSGFQFFFFGRMDYQDFNMRKNLTTFVAKDVPKSIEWVWQPSKTFGDEYQLFTGELYGSGGGGYGSPNGFGFDGSDNQVQDDPRYNDYNLDQFMDNFINTAKDQAAHMRTNHIIWAMGSDFNYQNADHWYHNIDKLIHHVNKNGTVNAFYSTPSIYTECKFNSSLTWEARYDDIMPLADNAHHYWSGYFTSRQSLKRYTHEMTTLLQAGRQLARRTSTTPCATTSMTHAECTDNLEAAISLTTHHDGISGTEKQAVADDYALRIGRGEVEVRNMIAEVFRKELNVSQVSYCNGELGLNISFCAASVNSKDSVNVVLYNPQGRQSKQPIRIPISTSSASVTTSNGQQVASQVLPIDDRDASLSQMYLQFPEKKDPSKVARFTNNATHIVSFIADLPPVGWQAFTIDLTSQETDKSVSKSPEPNAEVSITNGIYQVTFDTAKGTMTNIKNLKSGVSADVSIDIGFYNSSLGGCTKGVGTWQQNAKLQEQGRNRREEYEYGMDDMISINDGDQKFACDDQISGAYIFRPNSSNVWPAQCTSSNCNAVPTIKTVEGSLVNEVHISFVDWATTVVRLIQNMSYVEVEYTVGPIPIWNFEQGVTPYLQGKEVVLRYNTSINSKGSFWTDSNAREMIERQINKRGPSYPANYQISEPVAGNFYPINSHLGLQDNDNDVALSISIDRAVGGASLANGELEFMVHRRTQADDRRGVAQPMNETMCGCRDQDPNHIGQCQCVGLVIKGIHRLVLDKVKDANRARRAIWEDLNFNPVVAFTNTKPSVDSSSGISKALPENVKLMTMGKISPQYNDQMWIRLAHLFEAGEHPSLSQPVNVSLTAIFGEASFKVKSAKEMSLTGNRTPQELENIKMKWKVAGEQVQMPKVPGGPIKHKMMPFDPKDPNLTVELRPMDIRTFVVELE